MNARVLISGAPCEYFSFSKNIECNRSGVLIVLSDSASAVETYASEFARLHVLFPALKELILIHIDSISRPGVHRLENKPLEVGDVENAEIFDDKVVRKELAWLYRCKMFMGEEFKKAQKEGVCKDGKLTFMHFIKP